MIETFLAALKELAKAGARYVEEEIRALRESFRTSLNEARDVWRAIQTPEYFAEYRSSGGSLVAERRQWHDDSSSDCCPLCMMKFTVSKRRHHCRACGILTCALCSEKRLQLNLMSSPNKTEKEDRVCDPCFNRLLYESKKHKAKKSKVASSRTTGPETSSVFSSPESPSYSAAAQEAMDGLHKRGAAVEAAHERGEEMETQASEFSRMTKELLKQQQSKGIW